MTCTATAVPAPPTSSSKATTGSRPISQPSSMPRCTRAARRLIAITWDEGGSGNKPIGMILLSPETRATAPPTRPNTAMLLGSSRSRRSSASRRWSGMPPMLASGTSAPSSSPARSLPARPQKRSQNARHIGQVDGAGNRHHQSNPTIARAGTTLGMVRETDRSCRQVGHRHCHWVGIAIVEDHVVDQGHAGDVAAILRPSTHDLGNTLAISPCQNGITSPNRRNWKGPTNSGRYGDHNHNWWSHHRHRASLDGRKS